MMMLIVPYDRLVFDKDSGKPKGYGFCEYADPETAQSAIRNYTYLAIMITYAFDARMLACVTYLSIYRSINHAACRASLCDSIQH